MARHHHISHLITKLFYYQHFKMISMASRKFSKCRPAIEILEMCSVSGRLVPGHRSAVGANPFKSGNKTAFAIGIPWGEYSVERCEINLPLGGQFNSLRIEQSFSQFRISLLWIHIKTIFLDFHGHVLLSTSRHSLTISKPLIIL